MDDSDGPAIMKGAAIIKSESVFTQLEDGVFNIDAIKVFFDERPKGLTVDGVSEWTLQGQILTLEIMGPCLASNSDLKIIEHRSITIRLE
jgi:hypothetical protein